MKIELSNATLKATFDTLGAELISLHDGQGVERIWAGDPAYWSGHSPVLFPIIGSLNSGRTTINGASYRMVNHGFARRNEFEVLSQSDTEVLFVLKANENTRMLYPYHFELQIKYWLEGNTIHTEYLVKNNGTDKMFFQLGAHPAFSYHFDQANQLSDWYLEFNQTEEFVSLSIESNLINYQAQKQVQLPGKRLALSTNLFADGALIFEFLNSDQVTFKSKLTSKSITLKYKQFPHLSIWQPVGAPFICIETWQGMGDPIGYTGSFEHKPYVVTLKPAKTYQASLSMTFNG